MDLSNIAKLFGISSKIVEEEHITIGHINLTYRVKFETGEEYIMQRINKYVFKDPDALMNNIILTTTHIKNELIKKNLPYDRYVLSFIKALNGKYYSVDNENEYWRMYHYISHSLTYNVMENLNILENCGYAFGNFQCQLSNFDASLLSETIPNFHNTISRFENLRKAKEKDEFHRFESVKDLYNKYMELEEISTRMTKMLMNKELPLRVTHNDTKCNNVLFDIETGEPLSVIDLDTVMPGLAGFDFGDSIRTGGVNNKEDESDPSKIFVCLDKFEAFAKGFLKTTKDSLTQNEIDTLALGAITMSLECGARFLTDYLEGDVYFKEKYKGQNLIRAKSQLIQGLDMINKLDKLNEIIKNLL